MLLTPFGLWSVLGLTGCARDVVVLEPIDEEVFEQSYLRALCHATVRCGSPYYATEDECMEWRDDDPFSEGKWWLSVVCPGAVYDPVQAAACLDQVLQSPWDCDGIWSTPACGNMDWYRGVCSEVNSAA